MEMMEARVYRTSELNGDLSEDEDVEGKKKNVQLIFGMGKKSILKFGLIRK